MKPKNNKLDCEKSYWEMMKDQTDITSKFACWIHNKMKKGKKEK